MTTITLEGGPCHGCSVSAPDDQLFTCSNKRFAANMQFFGSTKTLAIMGGRLKLTESREDGKNMSHVYKPAAGVPGPDGLSAEFVFTHSEEAPC